eukprot:TRINITY_DN10176_c0_g1_i1.p2 TRINITY_DN10176_c0_g1~~TRINITY_DN10176_c0_g1_i1.p2  ORF type:complete len:155 (+),score=30.32 TRINITY_DN10176_c0_g1_i1:104-568(+)
MGDRTRVKWVGRPPRRVRVGPGRAGGADAPVQASPPAAASGRGVARTATRTVGGGGAAGGDCILCLRFPRAFDYVAGQYAELCVPAISRIEWHPFTIASAPHESEMVFYIKRNGDWTAALYELFAEGGSPGRVPPASPRRAVTGCLPRLWASAR